MAGGMTNDPPKPSQPRDFYYSSNDGLRLYARDYGDPTSPWLPVVCLPGLTRTGADFHVLASALAGDAKRPRAVSGPQMRAWSRKPSCALIK